jgi:hypothetical protein
VGLKLNGIYKFLVYADHVNLLGGKIDAIKSAESIIDRRKEVDLVVNAEKGGIMYPK